jgi:hypothetical protein
MPRITRFTAINKESLTTKLTLLIVGLTAGSALLFPATYASFHPVTSGEIADGTIRSADISNTDGVRSADIVNGQVASVDIQDDTITSADLASGAIEITRVAESVDVPPGESMFKIVSCPSGTLVTGGGFYVTGSDSLIVGSYPASTQSWYAQAFNKSDFTQQLTAYAVCV